MKRWTVIALATYGAIAMIGFVVAALMRFFEHIQSDGEDER